MDNIKIASLYVRGLHQESKRKEIYHKLRTLNVDVTCMQETHCTEKEQELYKIQWGGGCYFNNGSSNSRGTMILIHLRVKDTIKCEEVYKDTEGRSQIVKIVYDDRTFLLVNVYAPNCDEPAFFKELFKKILETQVSEMIIIGDYNLVLDPSLDRTDNKQYAPRSVELIKSFMEDLELTDAWRDRNPDKKQMSWRRRKALSTKMSGSRIDLALISMSLVNVTENITYTCGHKTDHALLSLEILQKANARGPGYWKFNRLLLHDKIFVDRANEIIKRAQNKFHPASPDKIWECCMDELTRWAKKKSHLNAKRKKEKFQILLKKVQEANENIHNFNEQKQKLEIVAYEKEIQQYLEEENQKAVFRSKVKYTKEYERSTKFFLSLEKAKYNSKVMSKLITEEGTEITDPKKILAEQYDFYSKLYRSDPGVKFQAKNLAGPKLNTQQTADLDREISYEEVTAAVKSFPRNKCPGPDGILLNLYSSFGQGWVNSTTLPCYMQGK